MPSKLTADFLAAVPVKVFVSALTLSLALTGYGCGADRGPGTPISPSPMVPGAPPGPDRNSQGELWGLTTAIVSLEARHASGHTLAARNSIGHSLSSEMGRRLASSTTLTIRTTTFCLSVRCNNPLQP